MKKKSTEKDDKKVNKTVKAVVPKVNANSTVSAAKLIKSNVTLSDYV